MPQGLHENIEQITELRLDEKLSPEQWNKRKNAFDSIR